MKTLSLIAAGLAVAFSVGQVLAQTSNQPAQPQTESQNQRESKRADDRQPPVPGANSFTETQARERIEKAGYSGVTGLTKDNQGFWKGQASKDGKQVAVVLDFRGNVVQQ